MGGAAQSTRVDGRMIVDNVRADGLVDGHRSALRVGGSEQAVPLEPRATAPREVPADCFAHPQSFFVALRHGLVNETAGFLGHAELAATEHGGHVLRSRAHQGNLKIVNQRRAVHGYGSEKPAVNQVDENGAETTLDDVAS